MVRRSELLRILAEHAAEIRGMGIRSLSVFGSVARDEAGPTSDVDLIAEFDRPVGYLGLAKVQLQLERILGCGVDLATPGMIRPEFRDRILGEAVRAA